MVNYFTVARVSRMGSAAAVGVAREFDFCARVWSFTQAKYRC